MNPAAKPRCALEDIIARLIDAEEALQPAHPRTARG